MTSSAKLTVGGPDEISDGFRFALSTLRTVTIPLTLVTVWVTDLLRINLAQKGRLAEACRGVGASAVPAGGFALRSRAAWASQPAGTTTGARGASLDGDRFGAAVMAASTAQSLRPQVGAGVKDRALRPSPRSLAWPGPRLRDGISRWQEPRWNAGRRARPQAEGGASRTLRGATRAPLARGT